MKWFQHNVDASDGETVKRIERKFGLEGYARWFKLLEKIARKMDETDRCSATYPVEDWATFLKCKRNKLETFLESLAEVSEISLKRSGDVLEIKCPKLLEIRDNHTRNLQATGKRLALHNNTIQDNTKHKPSCSSGDKPSTTPPKFTGDFEQAWSAYPEKVGKREAARHYRASVKTAADHQDLINALECYRRYVEAQRADGWADRRWQNGSTWFNNWRDWIGKTYQRTKSQSQTDNDILDAFVRGETH